MSNKQMRKQRWARLNKIRKRRVNMYALSQKVDSLSAKNDQFRELVLIDSEQADDRLAALEKKVTQMRGQIAKLQLETAKLKREQTLSWWQRAKMKWRNGKHFPMG